MYRFFVNADQIQDGTIRIEGEDVNHIRSVLRMRPGEEILISSGDEWEYTCKIASMTTEEVVAEILDAQKPGKELPSRICLFQCLPKGDKMELIIQKAVELGAREIVPVSSKRCVVKLDGKRAVSKVARWNAISESAAKQSKRMLVPEVSEIMTYDQALAYAETMDIRLIPYERAEGMAGTRKVLESITPGQSIGILIGPEGGFEEKEVQKAMEKGFEPITLGKRILRTETAGLTTLSILMYLLEQD
ncbi:MAG: 16S rRNA (uracil(1498)-N(3))-methyltransferase [Lachnospiraceae bacterium]|nr:16S rRNA (uracil(1498)-N(3))-methyltransferase [Lachnospiraceae bacterium]